MIEITQYRNKCIGCYACVELSFSRWRMSRKDGKSTLIRSKNKNGIYSIVVGDDELAESLKVAACCPVNIIKVKKL